MPTGSVETRQVIDGQQRLTTLQLFLAAARDVAESRDAMQHARAFATLVRNDLPLSKNPDEEFKIWPTNADRDAFRHTMRAGSREQVSQELKKQAAAGKTNTRITHAYLFFYSAIDGWLNEADSQRPLDRLDSLYRALQSDLLFVVIDLDERDDAQIIFETLNALGTPLLPADLVKNYLFHSAQSESRPIEDLYAEYWYPFDREETFWRQEITQGRLRRPRIDIFLQHYLTLETNDEVLVPHLFTTFRDHVRRSRGETAGDHLARLAQYGAVFHDLINSPIDSRAGLFLRRLELLETSTAFPFLLELFARGQTSVAEKDEIFVHIESFLVRRVVCRLTTKNYNRLFLDLVQRLRAEGSFSADAVERFLLEQTGESGRWPDDKEFYQNWTSQPLYTALVRRRVRLILEAIDFGMFDPRTERRHADDDLTVEHLMPQSWERHWPLASHDAAEKETARRNALLHTIGNLTLLTKKLNPEVSNGPWSQKRERILLYSALNLNRELMHAPFWTEEQIVERSYRLFEIARTIWPHPAAQPGLAMKMRDSRTRTTALDVNAAAVSAPDAPRSLDDPSGPLELVGSHGEYSSRLEDLSMNQLLSLARYRGLNIPAAWSDTPSARAEIIAMIKALPEPVELRSDLAGKRVVRRRRYQKGGNPRQPGSHGFNAYEVIPLGEFGIRVEDLLARIKTLPAKSSERYGAGGTNHIRWDLDHGHTYLIDDPGFDLPE
jgi:hypothetical protein